MEDNRVRQRVNYNLHELKIIDYEKDILITQITVKELKGINKIYPNQNHCGQQICEKFQDLCIISCLVYGLTQSGKTGCMTSLIQHYVLSNPIPIDNIYIITGLSDIEWKKDTKNRMPDSINKRVFHRANLPKEFLKEIRVKKNCLIIMDEIQIACKEDQTINKVFENSGFYDLDFLMENDMKIIQFSATPDGHINDISDWNKYSATVNLLPGDNHYGPMQALQQNRVKPFKDLSNNDNVLELKNEIENRNFEEPRYHLIRVPNKRSSDKGPNKQSVVISNFKKTFEDICEYNTNFLNKKKGDINDILKIKPDKDTFIFYCEILRCAKTQYKKFIGVSYERYAKKITDSTIVQGAFGRLTGYDDNGDSICYTNISSLVNYITLWDNNMEFKKGIVWNTKTTQYDKTDDFTYSTGTFNNVKHIEQLKDCSSEKVKRDREEPIIKKFNDQQEMIVWFKDKLKKEMPGKRGPRKRKTNAAGFYTAAVRDKQQVYSTDDIYELRKWAVSNPRPNFRSWPCYTDVNDPSTLQWWLIYYEE